MRVVVLGAGKWGTALAVHLGRLGNETWLWGRSQAAVERWGEQGERTTPDGAPPAENLTVSSDLAAACEGAGAIVVAVPSHAVRQIGQLAATLIDPADLVVSTAKGIELETGKLMTDVLADVLGPAFERIGVFSGPSFAKEVVAGLPTAVTAAGPTEVAEAIQALFSGPTLRVYTSSDPIGVQVGGAVKNVIALAAGMSDGMNLGANARAALITRGVAELARLAASLGADSRTISGLSGMGDLVLTCTGDLSRNRTVGLRLGQGESLDAITESMSEVAEGVHNTRSIYEVARVQNVDMPITEQMFQVIEHGKQPRDAVVDLMTRAVRPEIDPDRDPS